MIRKTRRVANLVLLTSALGLATLASAALKDKPPDGVTLGGTSWLLDPYRSDDPNAAIQKAHEEAQNRARSRDRGRTSRGVLGDDDPWGGSETGGRTWGGGFPGGSNPHDPLPDGGGGWRSGRGGNSTSVDPTGGTQSATIRVGGSGPRNALLGQLGKNPEKLSFLQAQEHLTVTEDRLDIECAAGAKAAISDSYGDGERSCGWDGRAWVVETTRGKRFKRIDRYEPSKDGKTLTYTTTATGQQMPNVRISRTYTVAPADD